VILKYFSVQIAIYRKYLDPVLINVSIVLKGITT